MSRYRAGLLATPLYPLHALLLACPVPLFLGALLADVAYVRSYHIQWANFASWLVAGGVAMGTLTMLWALVDVIRPSSRTRLGVFSFIALLAMWVLGIVNALVHARDAWGAMPEGLYLSAIVALLAVIAAWLGYANTAAREAR